MKLLARTKKFPIRRYAHTHGWIRFFLTIEENQRRNLWIGITRRRGYKKFPLEEGEEYFFRFSMEQTYRLMQLALWLNPKIGTSDEKNKFVYKVNKKLCNELEAQKGEKFKYWL